MRHRDLIKNKAISKMKAPYQMNIIDIEVTNRCNLSCSNCTRLLTFHTKINDMSIDNFVRAVESLVDFPGIIALLGGNPCLHPQFEEISRVFETIIPDRKRRGLWTNHFFNHRELCERIYGLMNLNPHGDSKCIESLSPLRRKFWYHEGHSEHSPILVAVKDFYCEDTMWELISQCDINQNWSATIIQYDGKLFVYFCEVAAYLDLLKNKCKYGIEIFNGWWKESIFFFEEQITNLCIYCGIPMRLKGQKDFENIYLYSRSNMDIIENGKMKKANLRFVESITFLQKTESVTAYSLNLKTYIKIDKLKTKIRRLITNAKNLFNK